MQLLTLFWISLGAYVLLYLAASLAVRSSIKRRTDSIDETIWLAGVIACLGALRAAALTSSITTGVLLILFALIDLFVGSTSGTVLALIEFLELARDRLIGFGEAWGTVIAILLIVGMAVHAYRRGRRKMEAALQRVIDGQLKELRERQSAGTLEELKPNARMLAVTEGIQSWEEHYSQVESDTTLSGEDRDRALSEIEAQISLLKTHYAELDVARRVDAEISRGDVELPQPRNWWERLQTVFISQGLLRCCGVGTRFVYGALLIVLIPSFLGAYSPATNAALDDEIVDLTQLRLSFAQQEADAALAVANESNVDEVALSEQDQATLQEFASYLEEATLSADRLGIRGGYLAAHQTLRTALVRQQILQISTTRPDAAFRSTEELSDAGWLTSKQRKQVSILDDIGKRTQPRTDVGREIFGKLADKARRSPGFLQKLKTDLRTFQRPVTGKTFRAELVGDLIDGRKGGLSATQQSVLKKTQLARATDAISQYATGKTDLRQTLSKAAVPDEALDIVRTQELIDLRTNFRRAQGAVLRDSKQLAEKVSRRPPASLVEKPVAAGRGSATAAVERLRTRQLARLGPTVQATRYADTLATYADYFPHRAGADTVTARGKLVSKWSPEFAKSKVAQVRFQRGFSFNQLRGFTRVGGVLIGREPEGEAQNGPLDVKDITWSWSGDRLTLSFKDADGQWYTTREYHPRIAFHALNYAADGRPLTVTIVDSGIPGIRSTMLHPTLINTPLGQRMIDIDNFVYDFTKGDTVVQNARRLVDDHRLLHAFVHSIRLSKLTDQDLFRDELREWLAAEHSRATAVLAAADEEEMHQLISRVLAEADAIEDPDRSPLRKMNDRFDQNLVSLISHAAKHAAKKNSDPKEFLAFVHKDSSDRWNEYRRLINKTKALVKDLDNLRRLLERQIERGSTSPDVAERKYRAELAKLSAIEEQLGAIGIHRWSLPVPQFKEASGVRELSFSRDLQSLVHSETPAPANLLRFAIQLATSSPAYFADESDTDTIDEPVGEPWEFESLRHRVEEAVKKGIDENPDNRQILNDVAEFTELQRLFRLALQGQMGDEFPLEQLTRLADDLSKRLPPRSFQTQQWDIPDVEVRLGSFVEIELAMRLVAVLSGNEAVATAFEAAQSGTDANFSAWEKALETAAESSDVYRQSDLPKVKAAREHARLLADRIRQCSRLVISVEELGALDELDEEDRKRFDIAWTEYVNSLDRWLPQWEKLSTLEFAVTENNGSSSNTESELDILVKSLGEYRDLILLRESLGVLDDIHLALTRMLFARNALPTL